jgi:S-DNA-T family DNA segregation ATPase FtsK/SpoIIIE
MRGSVRGEQYAQVDNPDPFASPVWRSPVYRTPEFVIWIVQLFRLLWRVLWFVIRHPGLDVAAGVLLLVWVNTGWQGLATLAGVVVTCLAALRLASPRRFTRLISAPARNRWRWWCYRRRWQAVMTISRLAPLYQGRVLLPVLGRVSSSRFTDRVTVGMVSGQSPKDFADRAEGLAHGFGVRQCRVRSGRPGTIVLELVRRDALAEPMPALPIPATVNLRALPVGHREDGALLVLRLHGTHLLIAGATGAGKGSWLWGLIRAMLPAMAAGLVHVLACDPKLMELAFGRSLFDCYGRYAANPADIAVLLEEAVADMQARPRCPVRR